jgi:hypothetical protein
MKFARYTFLIAGIYGLLSLLPHYFAEGTIGRDHPPAITHPEYFYGFVGIAVVFQIVFLIIAKDPVKYRLVIIPSVLEKASFAIPAAILFGAGNLAAPMFAAGMIDALLGILFIVSYVKLSKKEEDNPV